MNLYKQRFKYLPGDDPNALNNFGTNCVQGTGSGGASDSNCAGDGDGKIIGRTTGTGREEINVFHHLSLAQILQKKYSGGTHNDTGYFGVHALQGPFPMQGYVVVYDGNYGNYTKGNMIRMGGGETYGNGWGQLGIGKPFTAVQAMAIDAKMDDGNPLYGEIVQTVGNGICSSNGSWSSQKYATNDTPNACHLGFFYDRN